jgi:hypothetical protein
MDAGAQALDRAVSAQTQADNAAAASQQRINEIRDRTQDAAGRYAQTLAEIDSLTQYNEHLAEQVRSQEEEIASIERQLLDIETTNREVQPLMVEMVNKLDEFVNADLPFLLDERRNRVANLMQLLDRSDVAISEKYRRILEAYQIELEFGRTLEAYEGKLGDGADAKTVQFVKLGRVSLMYQTLDGAETGYYDAQQRKWVQDNNYARAVEAALSIARQEGAPDLLQGIPVPAPEEVRS